MLRNGLSKKHLHIACKPKTSFLNRLHQKDTTFALPVGLSLFIFLTGPAIAGLLWTKSRTTVSISLLVRIVCSIPAMIILLIALWKKNTLKRNIPGRWTLTVIDIGTIPILTILTLGIAMVFRIPSDETAIYYAPTAAFVLAILAAVVEELCYRSWLPWVLIRQGCPPGWAWAISIGIFAALHFRQGYYAILFAGCVAAIYTVYILRRGSLTVLISVHILYNIAALMLKQF